MSASRKIADAADLAGRVLAANHTPAPQGFISRGEAITALALIHLGSATADTASSWARLRELTRLSGYELGEALDRLDRLGITSS